MARQEDPKTREIARKILSKFPLYDPATHDINAYVSGSRRLVNYRTKQNLPFDSVHFDLQIEGDTCYLLEIGLEKAQRGKGLGRELYRMVEEIAKACECRRVVMTPSGTTPAGKTRKDYVIELGYREIGELEVEKIL